MPGPNRAAQYRGCRQLLRHTHTKRQVRQTEERHEADPQVATRSMPPMNPALLRSIAQGWAPWAARRRRPQCSLGPPQQVTQNPAPDKSLIWGRHLGPLGGNDRDGAAVRREGGQGAREVADVVTPPGHHDALRVVRRRLAHGTGTDVLFSYPAALNSEDKTPSTPTHKDPDMQTRPGSRRGC